MSDSPLPTTPLRLADAIQHAFPHGGMTVSGLRREAARGRLVIERIAGKDFTTLAAIDEMRKLCRVPAERPIPPRQPVRRQVPVGPDGLSVAAAALHAKLMQRKGEAQAEREAKREVEKAARKK